MSEPQYQSYFNHPHETMGVMASQLWRDDPKMVGIHLARYKFVAKMLAGKNLVAEVGCGDGWFSKVVRESVTALLKYDFDIRFVHDEMKRTRSTLQGIMQHDMLTGKVPFYPYDAIYSLDVMEHIKPENEGTYLKNICSSLTDDGVCIIGMPSLESQPYASSASKIGHVNCKSGDNLKIILGEYFKNVFLFSMSDEVIHTGFYPMAHYLMALCVGVK